MTVTAAADHWPSIEPTEWERNTHTHKCVRIAGNKCRRNRFRYNFGLTRYTTKIHKPIRTAKPWNFIRAIWRCQSQSGAYRYAKTILCCARGRRIQIHVAGNWMMPHASNSSLDGRVCVRVPHNGSAYRVESERQHFSFKYIGEWECGRSTIRLMLCNQCTRVHIIRTDTFRATIYFWIWTVAHSHGTRPRILD